MRHGFHRNKLLILLMPELLLLFYAALPGSRKRERFIPSGFISSQMGEVSSSQNFDFAKTMIDVVKQVTPDYDVQLEKFASFDDLKEAFLTGKIDIAVLESSQIVEILDRGGDAYLWFTDTVAKRRKAAVCLWYKKDVVSKSISDITGKTVNGGAER